jgi:hypothetical protein
MANTKEQERAEMQCFFFEERLTIKSQGVK